MATKELTPSARSESRPAKLDVFATMREQMDELLEKFMGDVSLGVGREAFSPKVDIAENGKEVKVTAELPGMEEKDLEVTVSEGVLSIRGEKKQEKEEKGEEMYRFERSYGSFRRDLPLPCKVEVDKASARFAKGVLTVVLPKAAPAPESKKIKLEPA